MWTEKPLNKKCYGSIPHLPNSRVGPGDHHVNEGQFRICCEQVKQKETIYVEEKLDGSCVGVAKVDGQVIALGRAGYLASSSRFLQHRYFSDWVTENYKRFDIVLKEGERIVGEWLAQAHGTKYELFHEPFVAFDVMIKDGRLSFNEKRSYLYSFVQPKVLHVGKPITVEEVEKNLEPSGHGAIDPVEGAVWRVERGNKVLFLSKWLRPDKIDGIYLPEISNGKEFWNWKPNN
jgi:hypothetical protein